MSTLRLHEGLQFHSSSSYIQTLIIDWCGHLKKSDAISESPDKLLGEWETGYIHQCFFFFVLDTTTHQLVSILDLALKFNCLPLLVLEAKRKLFGETCSVSLYFRRCVCAAVPVSAEKQNQALPPWQVKSAWTTRIEKNCTLLTETLDTFLCPSPSFPREITPIFTTRHNRVRS